MKAKPQIVDDLEIVEFVPVNGDQPSSSEDILVFTIHDGDQVPRELWGDRSEEILARPEVQEAFVRERDWGANLVAEQLVRNLGLSGYLRVNLARVVLDFGRFPGTSAIGEAYLTRHAMFPPVELLLDENMIHHVLSHYYDGISRQITDHFADKRITLAVHTYDSHNATGTERPKISLVTRSLEYQYTSTLPPYVFDPLFPAILCEATGDRALTYQVLFDLEKAGHHTALNYPYVMPEGSVEIRAQVWFFFRHLREEFLAKYPAAREQPAFQRIWQMLLDVTRRSPACERMRAYLHRYRDAPQGQHELFQQARKAYREIQEFLVARPELVETWRYSPERPSSLGIEIRKDKLCELDEFGQVLGPHPNSEAFASEIGRIFADSVLAYVATKNEKAKQIEAAQDPQLDDETEGLGLEA